jgi:hypothetical protein
MAYYDILMENTIIGNFPERNEKPSHPQRKTRRGFLAPLIKINRRP